MKDDMNWETLLDHAGFLLQRRGRFLAATLKVAHRVLSTSVRNGGQTEHVRVLLNHQSCEGTAHHARHGAITAAGTEYPDRLCAEADLRPEDTAAMGTAANMNYAAIATESDGGLTVTAVVTAGVEGNATCAGDPATWRETEAGFEKVPASAGTINTMMLVNVPLTPAALARAVMTMTEGKSAALQRLAVPSRQSADLATGTGTDQYCVASPLATGSFSFTSTSPHVKTGELIGLACRNATQEALRWQNGLEASYTRGVFHALGRYGVKEATFFDDIAPQLSDDDMELLRKNSKAVLYEPVVGAAAHAAAAVLDRVRHGSLPASVQREAIIQQAALLAASLAAQPERWLEFRATLHAVVSSDPKTILLAALALGWSHKWRSS
jgi:adenosylcobinamide amidohydrolase